MTKIIKGGCCELHEKGAIGPLLQQP